MPYKRKDSRFWWVSYTDASGRQHSRSSKTTDWREAVTLEHQLRGEANRLNDPHADKTFDDVMLAFLEENPSERRSHAAKGLMPYFSGKLLSEIKAADVARYKRMRGHVIKRRDDGGKPYDEHRKASPGTLRRELGVFSAAINWCRKELGWEITNPVAGRAPTPPPGRLRWITRAEYAALLQAVPERTPYLAQYLALGVNTGMRSGEMLGLEWSRVDLQQNLVYLEPPDQKGRRYDSVPLNAGARAALLEQARYRAEHCPDSPWVFCRRNGNKKTGYENGCSRIASVKKSFAAACKGAGIQDFTPHDLRHTCAAWLVQSGVPIRTVAEILRHTDIHTTMRYAHLAPENAAAGVQALDNEKTPDAKNIRGL